MNTAECEELVVLDQQESCPYLPRRMARLPLRWPFRRLSNEQLDQRLAEGDRRSGFFLYRPDCPACSDCQAVRVEVCRFEPNRTQRRIERRGRRLLEISVGSPQTDEQRVELFNLHREQRGLARPDERLDAEAYRSFLVDTCCETLEITYRQHGKLVAVAICDRGRLALSAVYCFFDVTYSRLSPGVFSVLSQIRLCREREMRYLYLGFYIAGSPHMSYKAGYLPHERLIGGEWQTFGRGRKAKGVGQRAEGEEHRA